MHRSRAKTFWNWTVSADTARRRRGKRKGISGLTNHPSTPIVLLGDHSSSTAATNAPSTSSSSEQLPPSPSQHSHHQKGRAKREHFLEGGTGSLGGISPAEWSRMITELLLPVSSTTTADLATPLSSSSSGVDKSTADPRSTTKNDILSFAQQFRTLMTGNPLIWAATPPRTVLSFLFTLSNAQVQVIGLLQCLGPTLSSLLSTSPLEELVSIYIFLQRWDRQGDNTKIREEEANIRELKQRDSLLSQVSFQLSQTPDSTFSVWLQADQSHSRLLMTVLLLTSTSSSLGLYEIQELRREQLLKLMIKLHHQRSTSCCRLDWKDCLALLSSSCRRNSSNSSSRSDQQQGVGGGPLDQYCRRGLTKVIFQALTTQQPPLQGGDDGSRIRNFENTDGVEEDESWKKLTLLGSLLVHASWKEIFSTEEAVTAKALEHFFRSLFVWYRHHSSSSWSASSGTFFFRTSTSMVFNTLTSAREVDDEAVAHFGLLLSESLRIDSSHISHTPSSTTSTSNRYFLAWRETLEAELERLLFGPSFQEQMRALGGGHTRRGGSGPVTSRRNSQQRDALRNVANSMKKQTDVLIDSCLFAQQYLEEYHQMQQQHQGYRTTQQSSHGVSSLQSGESLLLTPTLLLQTCAATENRRIFRRFFYVYAQAFDSADELTTLEEVATVIHVLASKSHLLSMIDDLEERSSIEEQLLNTGSRGGEGSSSSSFSSSSYAEALIARNEALWWKHEGAPALRHQLDKMLVRVEQETLEKSFVSSGRNDATHNSTSHSEPEKAKRQLTYKGLYLLQNILEDLHQLQPVSNSSPHHFGCDTFLAARVGSAVIEATTAFVAASSSGEENHQENNKDLLCHVSKVLHAVQKGAWRYQPSFEMSNEEIGGIGGSASLSPSVRKAQAKALGRLWEKGLKLNEECYSVFEAISGAVETAEVAKDDDDQKRTRMMDSSSTLVQKQTLAAAWHIMKAIVDAEVLPLGVLDEMRVGSKILLSTVSSPSAVGSKKQAADETDGVVRNFESGRSIRFTTSDSEGDSKLEGKAGLFHPSTL